MIIAFSTYSRIPMPQVEWNERNMRWSMAFLPFIGVVIGLLFYGWQRLALWLQLNPLLFAAVATLLPLLVSGGIHLDGFCDTADALSSHQSRERKLEILKDPHIGAFGVMACMLYLLLWAGCMAQLQQSSHFAVCCMVFVLSRTVSGLAVQHLPNARGTGMLQTFTDGGARKGITILLSGWLVMCVCLLWMLRPWLCSWILAALAFSFGWFVSMSRREFGGVTGDLIGCYLQLCELVLLVAMIVGEQVWNFM
jgi:adenosylcobinamide-GDP ribazoletransferase